MTSADSPFLVTYNLEDFRPRPRDPCDLILEGGVASGAVHPYVVLELARKHRFNAIGATSAGANAGVLAAAAEYARTVRGDPGGFLRLQKICEERAGGLGELFQESPGFEPLMALVKGRGGFRARLLAAFGGPLATGGLAGALLALALAFAVGGWPASFSAVLATLVLALGGAVLGALAAVGMAGLGLARRFNARLGICTGLTRRGLGTASALIKHGPLTFDATGRVAYFDEKMIELSARELSLLEVLLQRAGRLVSKDQLVERLCEWGEEVSTNAIEVYIHRLRKKIEQGPVRFATVRGLGYCLEKIPG